MPLDPTPFTPWMSLLGGVLIGIASLMVLGLLGRIAGISGITLAAMRPGGDRGWRIGFLLGLVAAPLAWAALGNGAVAQSVPGNLPAMALAGLLVGAGSILGAGCTSGHGVCGLSRLSPRSMVAVPLFMAVAAATVFAIRHLLGGGA
ncbi:YeeE/YedE family protein [Paralimibaculum aggregatum]|uniref:YeeE/YedE family protein n=1 Tax=Paralimibaculum aggregatum TaxID=3036245 RepID=A0ABQ6LRW0_9RHOB|nr:YeeE/YedE family protein [Limibaculum sp. NKW23]GMG84216.1 YeeE/YedE family protein [Limibaculum sp. NKW23]